MIFVYITCSGSQSKSWNFYSFWSRKYALSCEWLGENWNFCISTLFPS